MIIDLQRRIAEIGRIRIGEQIATANGKRRPAKLATFRLTSQDPTRIKLAADLYGGQPRRWESPAGPAFEVVTEAAALEVMVPPSDMAFSQHYELWSAGGCQRRCDGETESIGDRPCVCDPDQRECAIHTRLSVMLRDLPGLGVWRIDTSGYYAAVELQGAVQVIQMAAGRGQILPARLRLEQRTVKRLGRDGKPETRRFAVPVLDVEISPGQLLGASPRPMLDAAPARAIDGTAARALEAAADTAEEPARPARSERPAAPLTPVPDDVPTRQAGSIAEQVARAANPEPRKRTARSAQPVPRTGIVPRTAAHARAGVVGAATPPVPQPDPEDRLNSRQRAAILAGFNELGLTDRDQRLAIVAEIVGRSVDTTSELAPDEATAVLDEIRRRKETVIPADEPPADEPALDAEVVEPEEPAPDVASASQVRAIRRALSAIGITSTAGQLDAVAQITGRRVALAELYAAEAVAVLDVCAKRKKAMTEAAAQEQLPDDSADDDRWDEYLATNPVDTGDAS